VDVTFESGSRLTGVNGFQECTSLRQIALPPSLDIIGLLGLSECTSLMEVIFEPGSRITAIKGFRGCTSLSRIAFPPSLQSLQSVHWITFAQSDSIMALQIAFENRLPAGASLRKIKCFITYPDESLKAKRRGVSLGFVRRNISDRLLPFS
jgi:hypothetical protein